MSERPPFPPRITFCHQPAVQALREATALKIIRRNYYYKDSPLPNSGPFMHILPGFSMHILQRGGTFVLNLDCAHKVFSQGLTQGRRTVGHFFSDATQRPCSIAYAAFCLTT